MGPRECLTMYLEMAVPKTLIDYSHCMRSNIIRYINSRNIMMERHTAGVTVRDRAGGTGDWYAYSWAFGSKVRTVIGCTRGGDRVTK